MATACKVRRSRVPGLDLPASTRGSVPRGPRRHVLLLLDVALWIRGRTPGLAVQPSGAPGAEMGTCEFKIRASALDFPYIFMTFHGSPSFPVPGEHLRLRQVRRPVAQKLLKLRFWPTLRSTRTLPWKWARAQGSTLTWWRAISTVRWAEILNPPGPDG